MNLPVSLSLPHDDPDSDIFGLVFIAADAAAIAFADVITAADS